MSHLFMLPKIHFATQVEKNVKQHHQDSNQGVRFFQSNVHQLGSLTKKVALPTIVCGLRPT